MNIRIVIADDHPVILAGVREALGSEPGITVVAGAEDSTSLVDAMSKLPVDVAVTDFSMPGGKYGDGAALLGFLRRALPAAAYRCDDRAGPALAAQPAGCARRAWHRQQGRRPAACAVGGNGGLRQPPLSLAQRGRDAGSSRAAPLPA
ncbi:hypothetical protein G6F24_017027 [Rhizopus arrhizus]|nr:hypothetical protein G6F24_017027 [Rhizopus arrhizus]